MNLKFARFAIFINFYSSAFLVLLFEIAIGQITRRQSKNATPRNQDGDQV